MRIAALTERHPHFLGMRKPNWKDRILFFIGKRKAFRVEGDRLGATALSTRYGHYYGGVLELLDSAGRVRQSSAVPDSGRVCLPPQPPGYQVVSLRIRRGTLLTPPMQVHLTDRTRLLGLVRN